MATRLANVKQRRRHAGALAFFALVGLSDVGAFVLAYLFGSTIGAWLLTFFWWGVVSLGAYLHDDLTATIFLLLLIPLTLMAVFAMKSANKAAAFLLSLLLVGLWLLLHFVFHAQGITPFIPNLDRFVFAPTGLQPCLAQPNPLFGLAWLAIHLLVHLGNNEPAHVPAPAKAPAAPHPPESQEPLFTRLARATSRAISQEQGRHPPAVVESTLADTEAEPEPEKHTVYLNPLLVGEDKWDILAACIGRYEKALTRLYPKPIPRLKVPPRGRIFYVKEGNQIIWHWHTLVLTESLLDPHNDHRLETALARALWDYNSPDLWLKLFLSLYPEAPGCLALPMSLLGVFIWLPAAVKSLLRFQDWRADRVLAADRFAWACGAGETLLHQIRWWIAAGLEEPDLHLPRFVERKGQLEALLKDEQSQIQTAQV
ncbi:MAG TPA: hypothetical protein VIY29_01700 [Ktedonobacteraceae bacterium]